jgi:hypothetical protein
VTIAPGENVLASVVSFPPMQFTGVPAVAGGGVTQWLPDGPPQAARRSVKTTSVLVTVQQTAR